MSIIRVPWQAGSRWKGALDNVVAYYLLEQYFKPGDTIIDPMAGGGTTKKIGATLGISVVENDLYRDGGWDATKEWDMPSHHFDGVLLHPPYYKAKKYGTDPNDLGNIEDIVEFVNRCLDSIGEAVRCTKHDGTVIFIIGDYRKSGVYYPIHSIISLRAYDRFKVRMRDQVLWELTATGTPFLATPAMMMTNYCLIFSVDHQQELGNYA